MDIFWDTIKYTFFGESGSRRVGESGSWRVARIARVKNLYRKLPIFEPSMDIFWDTIRFGESGSRGVGESVFFKGKFQYPHALLGMGTRVWGQP